ncbi:MAG: NAD-binding protein, partial [Methanobacteriota archaeon]
MTLKILIIGGGKVGTYLASLLLSQGHLVKIVEGSEIEYPRIKQEIDSDILIKGNVTDPKVLTSSGIKDADVVAAVTRYDEMNLVITSLAKFEFRVPKTIARVNIPKNAWLFTPAMGVDVVLNQADLMAHLIAEEMTLGDMKTLLKLRRGEYSL